MSEIIVKFIEPSRWWKNSKWELMKQYKSGNSNIKVPKGFITNGASIPFGFKSFFSPTGKYFGAAIVHDYMLKSGNTFKESNKEMLEEMKHLGVEKYRMCLIYGAVSIYGFFKD